MKPRTTELILACLLIVAVIAMGIGTGVQRRHAATYAAGAAAYADTIRHLRAERDAAMADARTSMLEANAWRDTATTVQKALEALPRYEELRRIIPHATDAELAGIILWNNER